MQFIVDAYLQDEPLTQRVRAEIKALIGPEQVLGVVTVQDFAAADRALLAAWTAPETRVVVGMGMVTTTAFARGIKSGPPPKPTLLTGVIDTGLQGLPAPVGGKSGVANFGYLLSTVDVPRDFKLLNDIRPFTHLAVVGPPGLVKVFPPVETLLRSYLPDPKMTLSLVDVAPDGTVAELPKGVDAAYVLPLAQMNADTRRTVYATLAAQRVPSVPLLGRPEVELGAYAGVAPVAQFETIARRVALDVSRSLDGRDPAAFELHTVDAEEPSIWVAPLPLLDDASREAFETPPEVCFFPEVGSRAMHRMFEHDQPSPSWIVVQPDRYRFLASPGLPVLVRIVIGEYLACEAVWGE